MTQDWTGERIASFIYNETASEHLHRYSIAIQLIENKAVLDIACGEGYGSALLASKAKSVIGVDIDTDTIAEAKKKYKLSNLNFLPGSTSRIPVDDNSIDVVISFETIEHHDEHEKMLQEIKRVLKVDGILLISSPEKQNYSGQDVSSNVFHVKELYLNELKKLVYTYFKHADYYFQSYVRGSLLVPQTDAPEEMKFFTGNYKQVKQVQFNGMYNICMASDLEVKPLGISFFDDDLIHAIQLQQQLENQNKQISNVANFYKNSWSYRIGHFITAPYRKFFK